MVHNQPPSEPVSGRVSGRPTKRRFRASVAGGASTITACSALVAAPSSDDTNGAFQYPAREARPGGTKAEDE